VTSACRWPTSRHRGSSEVAVKVKVSFTGPDGVTQTKTKTIVLVKE
jgi:hypothetical protein